MAPLLAQKTGVDRAFERLYRKHAADVYRYAYAVLRNPADAEDVAQTTFMNAYRALERGETPQAPHNWLIAIAHNVCRQRFRQASRRVQEVGLDVDVADTLVRPEDDDAPSPEDIKRALGHLAFNQRAALVMRELEGRSYAEIADLLELSVGAVETLIFRARRALREQLEGTLTCGQAEQALSRQLDAELTRPERSQLRAHLRECATCRRLARGQRAQRSALKALGAVPLPSSLASLFGGGGAAVATKAAAVVVAASLAGGIGYDVHRQLTPPRHPSHVRAHQPAAQPSHASSPPAAVGPLAAIAAAKPAMTHGSVVHVPKQRRHVDAPRRPVVSQPTAEHPAAHPVHPVHPARPARPAQVYSGKQARPHAQPARAAASHGRRLKPEHTQKSHPASPHRSVPADGSPPSSSPPAEPRRQSGESSGKPTDAGPALPPVEVTTPLPVTLPPAADDLTQTSQTASARIQGHGHLHP
jgi:RNA polymerase sigma factor (sigma-70 family)